LPTLRSPAKTTFTLFFSPSYIAELTRLGMRETDRWELFSVPDDTS
jgi:hypothetical protein